jgi:hypothetical protein
MNFNAKILCATLLLMTEEGEPSHKDMVERAIGMLNHTTNSTSDIAHALYCALGGFEDKYSGMSARWERTLQYWKEEAM